MSIKITQGLFDKIASDKDFKIDENLVIKGYFDIFPQNTFYAGQLIKYQPRWTDVLFCYSVKDTDRPGKTISSGEIVFLLSAERDKGSRKEFFTLRFLIEENVYETKIYTWSLNNYFVPLT